jgi:hypothetical protein
MNTVPVAARAIVADRLPSRHLRRAWRSRVIVGAVAVVVVVVVVVPCTTTASRRT